MSSLAAIGADALVVLHLAFIAFVVAGAGLVLRWRWLAWLHVPAALWGVWIEFSGRICPLTPLENRLRAAAGEAGYGGGFIEHYLLPVIYPAALTSQMQWLLGALVLGVNAVAYAFVVRRAFSRPPRAGTTTPKR